MVKNNWKHARDSLEKDTAEDYVKRFWISLTKKNSVCILSLLDISNPNEAREFLSKPFQEPFSRVKILTK